MLTIIISLASIADETKFEPIIMSLLVTLLIDGVSFMVGASYGQYRARLDQTKGD